MLLRNTQASKEQLAAVEEAQLAQTTKERAARLHERRRLDDLANQRRMQTVSTCASLQRYYCVLYTEVLTYMLMYGQLLW
jgi:hypothetical protein